MYKCSKCGLENSKGSKYCFNCGNKLNKETNSTGHTKKIVIIIIACVLMASLIAMASVMLINLYKRDLPVYVTVGNTSIDSYTKFEDLYNNSEFEDSNWVNDMGHCIDHRDTGVSVWFFEDEGMIRIEDENDSGCIITPLGISSGMSVEQCFDALGKYSYSFDADCIRTKNEAKKIEDYSMVSSICVYGYSFGKNQRGKSYELIFENGRLKTIELHFGN